MIKIENLKKKYGSEEALNIPELTIKSSECFGLVGNNGAGKTTLFRLILDLIRASSGSVTINGEDVSKSEEWKRSVRSYLDENMLLSFLSPTEYFETLRKIYGLGEQDLENHLEKFRPLFNDEILGKKKYIRDLSKGNIKKVGIAAAFMGTPSAILLDEPFENLDPTSQNRLKKIIIQERNLSGTTFLISSHDLTHVTDICNRIVLLEKGVVLKDLKDNKEVMAGELADYFDRQLDHLCFEPFREWQIIFNNSHADEGQHLQLIINMEREKDKPLTPMKKNKEAKELIVNEKKITCPICDHELFWSRTTLLNTRGASFFNFDWLNREAENYVCDSCSHILWFHL